MKKMVIFLSKILVIILNNVNVIPETHSKQYPHSSQHKLKFVIGVFQINRIQFLLLFLKTGIAQISLMIWLVKPHPCLIIPLFTKYIKN